MSRVILDIETIGKNFDDLDKKSQEYLLQFAQDKKEKEEIKDRLALYPFTGEIVAIGLLNPDTNKGVMYYQNNKKGKEIFQEKGIKFETGSEKEILKNFWEDIRSYQQIITFNGRGFDAPFLHLRSALLKIRPTKNLMPYRYDYKIHCDLMEQLTFYSATRKFNLDFYTRSFGIKSPKDDGVDGSQVGELYKKGKYKEIARYCVRDLQATRELYEYWEKYLKLE